jgi:hypothetical protein
MSQSYSLNIYPYSDNVKLSFRSKFLKIFIFFLLLLFVVFVVLMSTVWRSTNDITKIEFRGNTSLSKDEIFKYAKLSDSVLFSRSFSLQFIEERISKHPNIKSVNAINESGKIIIEITEKYPVCSVVSLEGNLFFMDDKMNLCEFKKEYQNLDLPVITGFSSFININSISLEDNNKLKLAHYLIQQMNVIDNKLLNFISEISFSDTTCITLYSCDNGIPIYLFDYNSIFDNNNYFEMKSKIKYEEMKSLSKNQLINVNNSLLKVLLKEKLISLNYFIKDILYYKGKNSFKYIDLRFKNMIFAKPNS